MRKTQIYLALLCFTSLLNAQANPSKALNDEDLVTVTSPDGRISFRLFNGPPPETSSILPRLAYEVDFNGKRLIDTSYLGFEIFSAVPLGEKLGLTKATPRSVDEIYSVPAGKNATIRNHYNANVAEYLQNGSQGRLLTVEVRVFNDGVAFRYWVPRSPPLETMAIENEYTQFVFAQDGDAYPLLLRSFQTAYEDQFTRTTLSGIHPESIIGLPFLIHQPGVGWAAITEADLDEYAGLYLRHDGDRLLHARLSPRLDGTTLAVLLPTPLASPWRVILIGEEPQELIESNIVPSLNFPSAIPDTSWIKPGKAIQSAADDTSISAAIDFAAETGLEYVAIASGWSAPGDRGTTDITRAHPLLDLPVAFQRARQKNVGIWLTVPWTAVDAQLEAAFRLFETWGVRGLKIDGMERDDQFMVDFYRRVARAAAEHRLMLGFLGAFKPDGMERTWPNVLTREAVLGLEYSKSGTRANPEHDVMLAFTRLLAGSMDYTPGGFKNVPRDQFQPGRTLGTRAHQLALFVVFESPLQTLADSPASYRGEPEFEFIKAVPASWDETRAISGTIGEQVAVARRKGADWYLGAITDWTAREVDIPLAFLGAGTYSAEIYRDDAANPSHSLIETRTVRASDRLTIPLASGGGVAIHFGPR